MSEHHFPAIADNIQHLVRLTARDVADARRLLKILASLEPVTSPDPSVDVWVGKGTTARQRAEEILERRRQRNRLFGAAMFGEPAWEMLLWLYALDGGARQPLSRLADAAGVAKSTALRWIDYLESHELVAREPHPTDRRCSFVTLTAKGREKMEAYLDGASESRD